MRTLLVLFTSIISISAWACALDFFFSSGSRHTRLVSDWSSDVCSSDLTTLLAQVDASIGGKTGVNLVEGKNLIGSFHQPIAVLIDPDVLATLPDREYRAGLFEVIKYGVIRSAPLFQLLVDSRDAVLARDAGVVDYIVEESVRIKAEVVSADERESDLRRILNFGHAFGHALEAETAYHRYLHGEAVGFGMRAATHLAKSL